MSAKDKTGADLSSRACPPPKKVTDVSGRGVGMDVVKTNLDRLGGKVEIISELGKGTTLPHQAAADAGHHPVADRLRRRRAVRHSRRSTWRRCCACARPRPRRASRWWATPRCCCCATGSSRWCVSPICWAWCPPMPIRRRGRRELDRRTRLADRRSPRHPAAAEKRHRQPRAAAAADARSRRRPAPQAAEPWRSSWSPPARKLRAGGRRLSRHRGDCGQAAGLAPQGTAGVRRSHHPGRRHRGPDPGRRRTGGQGQPGRGLRHRPRAQRAGRRRSQEAVRRQPLAAAVPQRARTSSAHCRWTRCCASSTSRPSRWRRSAAGAPCSITAASLPLVTLADAAQVKPIGDAKDLAVMSPTSAAARWACWAPCRWTWSRPAPAIDQATHRQKGVAGSAIIRDRTALIVDLYELVDAAWPEWARRASRRRSRARRTQQDTRCCWPRIPISSAPRSRASSRRTAIPCWRRRTARPPGSSCCRISTRSGPW